VKNKTTSEWLLFGLLVMAGVSCRIWFRDWPNFAPVAAISLFAGYAFTSRWRALLTAPAIMLLSDCVLGFYRWPLMLTVYSMLTLPIVAGWMLKNVFQFDSPRVSAAVGSFLGLTASSLAASILFFLVTNFVCWWGSNAYSQDWAGLVRCYTMALPFFRNTFCGDMAYSCLLFGGYGAFLLYVQHRALPVVPQHAVASLPK
jgi:hypothetical protein